MFGSDNGPEGLYAIGEFKELVGHGVDNIGILGQLQGAVELNGRPFYDSVDPNSEFTPAEVTGSVRTRLGGKQVINLAVSVNGVIEAVTQTYASEKGVRQFSALVPERALKTGKNSIEIFAVDASVEKRPLLLRFAQASVAAEYEMIASERGAAHSLLSPDGEELGIDNQAIKGWVAVEEEHQGGTIRLRGWAADVENLEPPQNIVVFAHGQQAYFGTLGIPRPDVVKHFGDKEELLLTGFSYNLPRAFIQSIDNPEIRLFAVSKRGKAGELNYRWKATP